MKKSTRFLSLLLAVILLASVLFMPAPSASAASVTKVQVTGSTVNVRKGAGTSYAKIASVKKGASYTYLASKTVSGVKWYQIQYTSSVKGWICGKYSKLVTTAAKTVTVTGSTVNVRKGAGTSYAKIKTVKKGAVYEYTDKKKASGVTWYKIKLSSSTSGWISGKYVKTGGTLPTTKATTTTTKTTTKATTTTTTKATTTTTAAVRKTVTITGSTVNVRKGAGTNYAKLTTVKKGATYTYTETKTVSGVTWYHITVSSSVNGWVSGDYAKKNASPTMPEVIPPAPENEMRAVWVPYMTLTNVTKEKIDSIVANAQKHKLNTIILHVHPYGDAMYDSDIFPASHFVTGTQGKALPFDVLGYTIEKAHAVGIEVHAWLNPLRIQKKTVPKTLSKDNPAVIWRSDDNKENDSWIVDYDGGKYYNPAVPEVRQLIVDGIKEIVSKYDVDGIHWDDYFYPASDSSFNDSKEYNAYKASGGTKSLLNWRKENINALVRDSYKAVKEIDSSVVFGISPGGNYDNARNAAADIDTWGKSDGYVDYLCPQIYWSFDHATAAFDKRCSYWRKLVTNPNIKFYVGLALYKAGSDDDKGTWKGSDSIIARQIIFSRSEEIHADGFMLYSYDYLSKTQTKAEVANFDKLFK